MKDIPIIFSAPMVLALLAGRKTQTRRLAWQTCQKCNGVGHNGRDPDDGTYFECSKCKSNGWWPAPWQKVKPGDRLWVRETLTCSGGLVQYAANHKTTHEVWPVKWKQDPRPSIHMPRAYSRLTLEVTATKIERLNAISARDAKAEGIESAGRELDAVPGVLNSAAGGVCSRAITSYRSLWTSLHGAEAWDANPEVVALTFTVHQQNIDAMREAA